MEVVKCPLLLVWVFWLCIVYVYPCTLSINGEVSTQKQMDATVSGENSVFGHTTSRHVLSEYGPVNSSTIPS